MVNCYLNNCVFCVFFCFFFFLCFLLKDMTKKDCFKTLKATLGNSLIMKNIILSVSQLVPKEVELVFDKSGLSFQSMDCAHVSLINVVLHAKSFMSFECPIPIKIFANLESIGKVLKTSTSKDSLCLQYLDNKPDILTLILQNSDSNSQYSFDLKLLEVNLETYIFPKTDCFLNLKYDIYFF